MSSSDHQDYWECTKTTDWCCEENLIKKTTVFIVFFVCFCGSECGYNRGESSKKETSLDFTRFLMTVCEKSRVQTISQLRENPGIFYDRLIIKICLSNVQIRCLFVFGVWIGCNFTDQMINGMIQNWSHQIECIFKVPSERRFFSNLYLYYQESLEHVSCDSSPLYVCFVSSDVSVFVVFVVRW